MINIMQILANMGSTVIIVTEGHCGVAGSLLGLLTKAGSQLRVECTTCRQAEELGEADAAAVTGLGADYASNDDANRNDINPRCEFLRLLDSMSIP